MTTTLTDLHLRRESALGGGIDVTNNDVRLAKVAWLTAGESDAPNDRVSDLYDDYAGLVSTHAQQIADGVRRGPRLVE